MKPLELLLNGIRTTTITLVTVVVYQHCSTSNTAKTYSPPQITKQDQVQLKNTDCDISSNMQTNFRPFLLQTNDLYDSELALIIHPGSVETRTYRMKGSSGHIGYDLNNGLYFRDESTQEQLFFKDGYVPNGTLMACDLKDKLGQVQFE